jgi:hypothetical protein
MYRAHHQISDTIFLVWYCVPINTKQLILQSGEALVINSLRVVTQALHLYHGKAFRAYTYNCSYAVMLVSLRYSLQYSNLYSALCAVVVHYNS